MSIDAYVLQRDFTYDDRVILDEDLLKGFGSWLSDGEKSGNSIKAYLHWAETLYNSLPDEKVLTREWLEQWRYDLAGRGYSLLSVKLAVSAANSLLKYLGMGRKPIENLPDDTVTNQTELTRDEYLTLMMALRERGAMREYMLVKTLVTVDVIVKDLPLVTVEACRSGGFTHPSRGRVRIPSLLGDELLAYAEKCSVTSGPVFVTRSGNNIDMSNVIGGIKRVGEESGIAPEKCSSKAFRRLYLKTAAALRADMETIANDIYREMLSSEENRVNH